VKVVRRDALIRPAFLRRKIVGDTAHDPISDDLEFETPLVAAVCGINVKWADRWANMDGDVRPAPATQFSTDILSAADGNRQHLHAIDDRHVGGARFAAHQRSTRARCVAGELRDHLPACDALDELRVDASFWENADRSTSAQRLLYVTERSAIDLAAPDWNTAKHIEEEAHKPNALRFRRHDEDRLEGQIKSEEKGIKGAEVIGDNEQGFLATRQCFLACDGEAEKNSKKRSPQVQQ
jgi:hypothetical protein